MLGVYKRNRMGLGASKINRAEKEEYDNALARLEAVERLAEEVAAKVESAAPCACEEALPNALALGADAARQLDSITKRLSVTQELVNRNQHELLFQKEQLSAHAGKLSALEESTSWTRAELSPEVDVAFAEADMDGNGRVTIKEVLEQKARNRRQRANLF